MENKSLKSWISQPQSKVALLIVVICVSLQISPVSAWMKGGEPSGGGGVSVSGADAKAMMSNYSRWNFSKNQKGGTISKQAIDAMFPAGTTNNVMCWYVAAEVMNGGRDTVLRLIVEPGTSTNYRMTIAADSKIFKSESLCPTECGSLGN